MNYNFWSYNTPSDWLRSRFIWWYENRGLNLELNKWGQKYYHAETSLQRSEFGRQAIQQKEKMGLRLQTMNSLSFARSSTRRFHYESKTKHPYQNNKNLTCAW